MWTIHIKLKCFGWEEKMSLEQEERDWPDFLWENKISELPILKIRVWLCLYSKQKNICMNV